MSTLRRAKLDSSARNDKKNLAGPIGATVLLCIALVGTVLVLGLALEAEMGSTADWIAALATVGALGAAVLAAIFTSRTLGVELARDIARDRVEAEAQAGLVAAWVELRESPDLPAQLRRIMSMMTATCFVRNASEIPVTDVVIWVECRSFREGRPSTKLRGCVEHIPILPPAQEPNTYNVRTEGGGFLHDHVSTLKSKGFEIELRCKVEFRDARGQVWIRNYDGSLEQADRATPRQDRPSQWIPSGAKLDSTPSVDHGGPTTPPPGGAT